MHYSQPSIDNLDDHLWRGTIFSSGKSERAPGQSMLPRYTFRGKREELLAKVRITENYVADDSGEEKEIHRDKKSPRSNTKKGSQSQ